MLFHRDYIIVGIKIAETINRKFVLVEGLMDEKKIVFIRFITDAIQWISKYIFFLFLTLRAPINWNIIKTRKFTGDKIWSHRYLSYFVYKICNNNNIITLVSLQETEETNCLKGVPENIKRKPVLVIFRSSSNRFLFAG
mgnify:CR=1 FL=1